MWVRVEKLSQIFEPFIRAQLCRWFPYSSLWRQEPTLFPKHGVLILLFQAVGNGQESKESIVLNVIYHRHNHIDFIINWGAWNNLFKI